MVFTHVMQEGACLLGRLLSERGHDVHTVSIPKTDLSQIDILAPDLLVVMGGPISVYQNEDYPFLDQEIDLIRKRIKAGRPVIGICLGAQLVSKALGARVYAGTQGDEVGWHPLKLSEAGRSSPARHLEAGCTNMFHWHGDVFDLPEGAELWASSALYPNQIYQKDGFVLAIQCHPEVMEIQLREWFVLFTGQITGDDPVVPVSALRTQTREHIETLNQQARLFFSEWLETQGL